MVQLDPSKRFPPRSAGGTKAFCGRPVCSILAAGTIYSDWQRQLNQMLNLVSSTDRPQNVTLHALENACRLSLHPCSEHVSSDPILLLGPVNYVVPNDISTLGWK